MRQAFAVLSSASFSRQPSLAFAQNLRAGDPALCEARLTVEVFLRRPAQVPEPVARPAASTDQDREGIPGITGPPLPPAGGCRIVVGLR